jgi:hypothetical protein
MSVETVQEHDTVAFELLERTLRADGPGAALDRLVEMLEASGPPRALLDALLLKARHELGLPLVQDGSLAALPEPARGKFEDRYVAAIRHVGGKLLAAGDIVGAWPYFRVLSEKEPVAAAIEAYRPEAADERIGQVIEVAFNQGAHPRRGFELILEHYGICSAITAFEHLPPEEAVRVPCAAALVRQLHEQLVFSLRSEIARRGQPAPAEGASIAELIAGKPWLFADDAYHIDISHLGSVVRLAPMLTDDEALGMAVGLTEYGRSLSGRHRYEGEPPFEDVYEDHGVYLRALRGEGVDEAVAHFRAKLAPPDPQGSPSETMPAQVLVRLLERVGRMDEAIAVAAEHLGDVPEAWLGCTSLPVLCHRAKRPDLLAKAAKDRGDLVQYAAAILQDGAFGVS